MSAPALRFLVFRKKTGCKQYAFGNAPDLARWLRRKPYCEEVVTVIEFDENRREKSRATGYASSFAGALQ